MRGAVSEFLRAVGRRLQTSRSIPEAVVWAAVDVLPIEGAGICVLLDDYRVPLAATSDEVRTAEALQVTLGDGPCLAAAHSSTPLVAGTTEIARLWPWYAEGLQSQTSFSSVAAVPLRLPDCEVVAALDLYAVAPDLPTRLDLPSVSAEISATSATLLAAALDDPYDSQGVRRLPPLAVRGHRATLHGAGRHRRW